MNENSYPAVLQEFVSEDGSCLNSLPTYPGEGFNKMSGRYLLWSDIQDKFPGIDYLEDEDCERVLYMVDHEFKLYLPLRIPWVDWECVYTVVDIKPWSVERKGPVARIRIHPWGVEIERLTKDRVAHGFASTISAACNINHNSDQHTKTDSLRHIQHLYQSYLHLHRNLSGYVNGTLDDIPGSEMEANLYYFYNTLQNTLETAVNLDESGSMVRIIGKSRHEILDEILELHQNLPLLIQLAESQNMTHRSIIDYGCSAPRWFIVLPSDLDVWLDKDPVTHHFRLYYLCQATDQHRRRYLHLSNHQGYDLKRPQEFFQKYGSHALRLLHLVKYGCRSWDAVFRALDTSDILWGCDIKVIGGYLSSETIGPLVDKAIAYIQELSPPRQRNSTLSSNEAREIAHYLEVFGDENSLGNLFRRLEQLEIHGTLWQCRHHARDEASYAGLDELEDYVHNQGGHADMVQNMIQIDLASDQQADEFLNLLRSTSYSFALHVRFAWSVERNFLERFLEDVSQAMSLEIEGETPENHSLDHVQYGHDICARAAFSIRLGMVRHLERTQTPTQNIYMGDMFRGVYGLQFKLTPNTDKVNWLEIESDMREHLSMILDGWYKVTPSLLARVSRDLKAALAKHGVPTATTVSVHSNHSWRWSFNLENTSTQLQIYEFPIPDFATIFSSQLTIDVLRPDLGDILETCPSLRQLNLLIQGPKLLKELEDVVRHWKDLLRPLHLTLFERTIDDRGRILAQGYINGQGHGGDNSNNESSGIRSKCFPVATLISSDVHVSQWDCDHFAEPLSDFTASLLDLASLCTPSALKAFTLDISLLSQRSLMLVQGVLHRSSLEQLIIISNRTMFPLGAFKVLTAAQTSPLSSIIFFGDSVDEWLQLWAGEAHQRIDIPDPFGPCLRLLQLIGSRKMPQTLSHASVLLLHRALYINPILELNLENVRVDGLRDQGLLARGVK